MKISVQKLKSNAELPVLQTKHSAGYDVHACLDSNLILEPNKVTLVPTGLSFAIPQEYHFEIRPRSGFSTKNRILIPNSPGTIDSDYRGELLIPLLNLGDVPFVIEHGMRIAQLLIRETRYANWELVSEFTDRTERGTGGFGSTGH
ncbi:MULTISPECIES: dUTP diphosphatase [Leptospira]|uniref:Deoxyuridine 5'-triphosphate nucleotidohydrolase n=6 Tax=Leptospira santarosai TaxID=28183 RepID=A0AB73NCE0_9LEPT|nr:MULTISPECIES: dUTP diphosphatase [Leptospira]EMO59407.1 dUTP diphosphatase [Leptospira santarosai str. CBC1416]ASV11070.1 dUTP diphosphatase [Leptospira santarosai]AVV51154.1 Deoxyuridine 5'-triphosphate nucleotidohydrolase [Leptospira santarosai]EKO34249.1 dUTP diphosphatase [Leptospira santarosai str. MOR084]EKO78502.1 dUTP diphosphatase [Leptospira sp. Fiocruz LV3954]